MTSFHHSRRLIPGRRRSGQVRQLPPRCSLQLLSLEERTTPSVTLSGYNAVSGQVAFTGDNNADTLVLARVETYPGSGTYVLQHNVSGGGLASFIDLNPNVAGDQVLQLGVGTDQNITVNLGNGSNMLALDDSWAFNHKVSYVGGTGTDEVAGTATGKTWTISDIANGAGNLGGAGVVDFSGVNVLTAGTGADILAGDHAARTWNLGATQQITDGSNPITFTGMDTLQGGTAVDTFNIQVDTAINIQGGDGNDVVAFKLDAGAPVLLTGAIDGEAGSDTLNYTNYGATDVVVAQLTGLGATDGFTGLEVSIAGTFTNIDAISAGANDANSIKGLDSNGVWTVGGAEQYVSTNTLSLAGIANLLGGSAIDTFNIGGAHSGNVDGGAGADVFNFTAGTLVGDVIGAEGNDDFNFSGGSVTGNVTGNAGTDTFDVTAAATVTGGLSGGDDADDFNIVNATLTGSLDAGAGEDAVDLTGAGRVTGNIVAGSDDDVITLAGTSSVGGTIAGGAGSDILSFAGSTNARTVTLASLGLTDGFNGSETDVVGFSDINTLVGSGNTDTLIGMDAVATWEIDGSNTYTSTNVLAFSAMENLTGGSAVDTFNVTEDHGGNLSGMGAADEFYLSNGATLTGNISGGAGADLVSLADTAAVVGAVAGGADSDTLTYALHTAAITMTMSGSSADGYSGTGDALTSFSGINVLTGTTGTDVLVSDANAAGAFGVNAANGGTFTYTGADEDAGTLAFSAMENLTGDDDQADTFDVGAAINILTGGSGADVFNINAGGSAASIVAGAGSDTLSYASRGGAASVTVAGSSADGYSGAGSGVTAFSGVNVLTGSGDTDTLTNNANAAGAFVVNAANGGTFTYTGADEDAGTLAFSAMENLTGDDDQADTFDVGAAINILTGGSGADVFNINAGGSAASIVAGAGSDTLSYASRGGAASVTVAGSSADGYSGAGSGVTAFSGVNVLTGSAASDTLISNVDKAGAFVVNAANAGTFTYTDVDEDAGLLAFSAIDNLTGDSEADEFNVTLAGSLSGTINGAGGTDTLTFAGSTGARTITLTGLGATDGYDGSEALVGGFSNIDLLVGSDNVDTLIGRNVEATWTVDGAYTYNSESRDITFSALENLQGGSDVDHFNLSADHSGNVSGMGGDDIMTLTVDADLIGNLAGGEGADQISLAGTSSVTGAVTGDAGNDSFALANTAMVQGTLAGGAGSDSLSYASYTNAVSVILTGPAVEDGYLGMATGVTGGFATMDSIAGRTAGVGADILKGEQVASTWTLGATNTYQETSGVSNTMTFAHFETLVGGAAADAFVVNNNDFTGSIDGGVGANSVSYAGNGAAVEVNFSGTNAGTVTGAFSFTNLGSWVGSAQADTFNFTANGAKVTGSINGGAGDDSLSYSGYTSAVRVNLNTGAATGAASIASFVNVTGGTGNDTLIGNGEANNLVGGGGNDTLVGNAGADNLGGGVGNDILIGGDGADTMAGGANDDILIGGKTTYDANISALNAIMAEWGRSDVAYATKVARISGTATGGLNGSFRFNDAAITDDVEDAGLAGEAGVDWFLASVLDEVDDLNTGGSEIVTTVS